jgi:hypothetical protein
MISIMAMGDFELKYENPAKKYKKYILISIGTRWTKYHSIDRIDGRN